nr:MAG TPA: hypothetical protein [Bacteriophage sp.]
MRYGILDVSAGRESLTTLFFSDIAPPCAPRQLLSYKAAGIFSFLWSMQMRDGIIKRFEKDFTFRG